MRIPWRPDLYSRFPLFGTKIMVNPGHGEKKAKGKIATGAVGKLGKKTICEKDLNDKVAENVRRKLQKLGAEVIYVDNEQVNNIPDLENEQWPDAFISIHHDGRSKDGRANSGETVYAAQDKGIMLGKMINRHLIADKTIPNNGVNQKWAATRKVLRADPSIPAVLVEVGYVTNPKELKVINTQSYQDLAAQCIVDGTKEYLVTKRVNETKTKKVENPGEILFKQTMAKFNSFFPKTESYDI